MFMDPTGMLDESAKSGGFWSWLKGLFDGNPFDKSNPIDGESAVDDNGVVWTYHADGGGYWQNADRSGLMGHHTEDIVASKRSSGFMGNPGTYVSNMSWGGQFILGLSQRGSDVANGIWGFITSDAYKRQFWESMVKGTQDQVGSGYLNHLLGGYLPQSGLDFLAYQADDVLGTNMYETRVGLRNHYTALGEDLASGDPQAIGAATFDVAKMIAEAYIVKRVSVRISVAAETETNLLKPLGRGSTGRTVANNLTEQLAMREAMSNPAAGQIIQRMKPLTDSRWSGWRKMQFEHVGLDGSKTIIHYNGRWVDGVLKAVDDFKFK